MGIKELEKLNDRNTLSQVVGELQKHFPLEKLASLNMLYRSFTMTQSFLPEIWDRILEDAQLHYEYWRVYAKLYDPTSEEKMTPTPEETQTLKKYKAHWLRLNLDIEDWFLHAHILMEKFARFTRELMLLTSAKTENAKRMRDLPTRSFHEYIDLFLKLDNQDIVDIEYAKIIKESTAWYHQDLKDVRDDLIQHEIVGKFWGSSISPRKLKISRFRHSKKLLQELYELRDKYARTYTVLKDEKNFFTLLSFFEKNIDKLEKPDSNQVKQIRKTYGREFPDIPTLYGKINNFFSLVNDYFMSKIRECLRVP